MTVGSETLKGTSYSRSRCKRQFMATEYRAKALPHRFKSVQDFVARLAELGASASTEAHGQGALALVQTFFGAER